MNNKRVVLLGVALLLVGTITSAAFTSFHKPAAGTLIQTVRESTAGFKDVSAAEAAGYGLFHGCVSGPQEGAMGIHYVNGDLVGDDQVDASQPEALIYEFRNGGLELVGVEYVVIAEAWDASHDTPPSLQGQVFNFVGAPNRYRIPAFYELHVWAWKSNPSGTFSDWNPKVVCDEYTSDDAGMAHH